MSHIKLFFLVFVLLLIDLFSQQVETLTEPFNGSGGIAVDKSGILYVSNFGSGFGASDGKELFKVLQDGTVEDFATGLSGGSGNAVDSDGNIFQSNINSNTVSKISPSGEVTLFANSDLYAPVGVAIDSKGNVFVANCGVDQTGRNSITKITPSGETSKFATSSRMQCPNGLTIDENDVLYTCNYNNEDILKIDTNGVVSVIGSLPGGNNSHLAYANNSLYVAKRCDNKIYQMQLDGTYQLIAGTGARGNQDGDPLTATINLPNGLNVSPDGDTLYFTSKTSFNGSCFDTDLNPVIVRMITGLKSITSVDKGERIPVGLELNQNYPNPFNPATQIEYSIPVSDFSISKVNLQVYDLLGNEIAILVDEYKPAGNYRIDFDASGLSSGVYFYVLKYRDQVATKKLTLLK